MSCFFSEVSPKLYSRPLKSKKPCQGFLLNNEITSKFYGNHASHKSNCIIPTGRDCANEDFLRSILRIRFNYIAKAG